jgi:hypothetical protein
LRLRLAGLSCCMPLFCSDCFRPASRRGSRGRGPLRGMLCLSRIAAD